MRVYRDAPPGGIEISRATAAGSITRMAADADAAGVVVQAARPSVIEGVPPAGLV